VGDEPDGAGLPAWGCPGCVSPQRLKPPPILLLVDLALAKRSPRILSGLGRSVSPPPRSNVTATQMIRAQKATMTRPMESQPHQVPSPCHHIAPPPTRRFPEVTHGEGFPATVDRTQRRSLGTVLRAEEVDHGRQPVGCRLRHGSPVVARTIPSQLAAAVA
jgi:hypothetical protein